MLIHKRKCLTIVPIGGLGNRLLALFSAIQLSMEKFTSLRVIWAHHPECDIAFEDIGTIDIPHEILTYNSCEDAIATSHIPRRTEKTVNKLMKYFDGQLIMACASIIGKPLSPKFFRFAEKHHQKADTIDVSNHIGIHCRRTDWNYVTPIAGQRRTPDIEERHRLFALSDNKLINYANNISNKLFIATDSPYTLANFKISLGDRLTNYPKSYYPNEQYNRSTDCVNDAIVDMILLSRCTEIIADSDSTFSMISSILGNIQKTNVTDQH
tara:strand:+ start:1539 stop:2342 length:804 start_codon:yes stop_codon:yes gene_type:complete